MRAARRGAGTSFLAAMLLAQLCMAGDCVDGATPDCSDAAAQCGPDLDVSTLDATSNADAIVDAIVDAVVAADADAGDQ